MVSAVQAGTVGQILVTTYEERLARRLAVAAPRHRGVDLRHHGSRLRSSQARGLRTSLRQRPRGEGPAHGGPEPGRADGIHRDRDQDVKGSRRSSSSRSTTSSTPTVSRLSPARRSWRSPASARPTDWSRSCRTEPARRSPLTKPSTSCPAPSSSGARASSGADRVLVPQRLAERLAQEEPLLRQAFPKATIDSGALVVISHDHALPAGWSHGQTDVLFAVPLNYPAGQPDNVCARPDLTLAGGATPGNTRVSSSTPDAAVLLPHRPERLAPTRRRRQGQQPGRLPRRRPLPLPGSELTLMSTLKFTGPSTGPALGHAWPARRTLRVRADQDAARRPRRARARGCRRHPGRRRGDRAEP